MGYLPQQPIPPFGNDTGIVNAYQTTIVNASLTQGYTFEVRINTTNTGASTLQINALGAKAIVDSEGNALTAGLLVDNTIYAFVYDIVQDEYQLLGLAKPSSTVPINNTVFVAKNGNDGTGLVERLDKPFLTFAAARTAALAAFTPSATNRILIKVFSGNYAHNIVLANFIDWDLSDSTISSPGIAIDDSGAAVNSIIMGNAVLIAGTNAIRTTNAGTVLFVNCDSITAATSASCLCTNGAQTINIRSITASGVPAATCDAGTQIINLVSANTGGSTSLICNGGTQLVYIKNNITSTGGSVASCIGGTQTVRDGSLIVGGGSPTVLCGGGIQNIVQAAIISVGVGAPSASITSGELTIYDSYLYFSSTGAEVVDQSGGTLKISNSRIEAVNAANISAVEKSGGTMILNNCTLLATGTGYSITSPSAQIVKVYGSCQANKAIDVTFAITQQVHVITIDANVI